MKNAIRLSVFGLLAFSAPSFAAIAYVQSNGEDSGVPASDTLAYTSNVTAGSLLIVAARHGSATASVTSITDTLGNTWQQGKRVGDAAGYTVSVWYANSPTGGANTVTINMDETQSLRWIVAEYSGIPSASIDVSSSAIGSSTTPDTGSATPTVSDVLAFSACSVNGDAEFTAGAGYTERTQVTTKISIEDKVVATPTATNGTWTLDGSNNWGTALVLFKGVSSSARGTISTSPGTGSIKTTPGTGNITVR